MPHQCTTCGRVFEDGSKEMLSGCPKCGGNTFQFHPSGTDIPDSDSTDATPPDRPEQPSKTEESVARTVGNAAATVRDFVGGSNQPSREPVPSPSGAEQGSKDGPEPTADDATADVRDTSAEDAAQASARSDVVHPDELSASVNQDASTSISTSAGTSPQSATNADDEDRPDLSELRQELNEQFESIKVVEPGQYELNLMELYDREEYVIALQEDGKYCIQVPETWRE